MAVLIGDLVPRTTVADDNQLQLRTTYGVQTVTVGERSFVYVAGYQDDGVSGFELGPGGSLTNVVNLDDGPALTSPLELRGATNFASATVGGATYLYVCSAIDNGISVFRVRNDGTLENLQNISDDDRLQLDGAVGKMSVAMVGGSTFLIASANDDNGVSVFRIGADGRLTNTDNVTNDSVLELNDAVDTTTATVDGRTFIFVAGSDDNGISVFELSGAGTLTNTDNVPDDDTLRLTGAQGVTTATVDGTTYLIASGALDLGLSVFAVSGTGELTNVFNVVDTAELGLLGPTGLTTFTLAGEAFVAVSAFGDKALSVFHVGSGGMLAEVTAFFDTAETALDGSYYNAFASLGGVPLLMATGFLDDGMTTFELGGGDDVLVGTGWADLLLGLGGNDRLDGAGGNDRMLGGSGNDIYVVESSGDVVEEHENAGTDLVRSSASFALGANTEYLELLGSDALDGTGNELDNILRGNEGSNELEGLAGKDHLFGADGADILRGGKGRDHLHGGRGADDLLGGKGADDLWGGKGRDVLEGGKGNDDFVFTSVRESGPSGGKRDRIEDFRGKDEIVLKKIDADKTEKGNQAFDLDGGGGFEAGEIRVKDTKAGVVLEMNIDNDARAEMSLLLVDFNGKINDNDFVF